MSETILFKHSCGSTCNCKGIDIWCPKCKVGMLISNKEFHIVELTSINKKEKKYFNSGKRVGRKQGALEELYKLSYYCDKAQVDERAIKRMILKRIKELEKEGVEK